MNDQQHALWLAYIRQLADLMRLKDWEINLARIAPESPTSDAQNFMYYGAHACEISLPQKFFGQSPEHQRALIAHELTHCHTEDLSEVIRLYISDNGHMDDFVAQIYQREMEVLVETIAHTIAPFLPLPGASNDTFEHRQFIVDPVAMHFPLAPRQRSTVDISPTFVVPTETFNGADR